MQLKKLFKNSVKSNEVPIKDSTGEFLYFIIKYKIK